MKVDLESFLKILSVFYHLKDSEEELSPESQTVR